MPISKNIRRRRSDTATLSQLLRDENYGCEVDQYLRQQKSSACLFHSEPFEDLITCSFTMY